MAAEAPSLGSFFKAKAKKKIKATNLNTATTSVVVDEKKKKDDKEDGAWEEEQVVATTLKVEVAGKLMREEEKKDDEDTSAPAWGNISNQKKDNNINEKRFPSLAKAVGNNNTNVNIDDGSDSKVNIATSKNHFASLEADDSDEEGGNSKRPKEIKPAMVTKKKGESAKDALKREVDKYTKKPKKKDAQDDDDGEEDDEEADEAEETAPAAEDEGRKAKAPVKKVKEEAKKPAATEEAVEEDLKIQPDLAASKDKYKGRKKLPPVDLPREELREEKENKPNQQQTTSKKKKMFVEEETDKKLAYADWD